LDEEPLGRGIAQGLMGADDAVDVLPLVEFLVGLGDRERARGDLIEFLRVGEVSAFHRAVEFGRAGREDEQAEAALLAGLLKDGGELAAGLSDLRQLHPVPSTGEGKSP